MKIFALTLFSTLLLTSAFGFRPYRTTVNTNLALAGYDPVIFFAEERAQHGLERYSYVYDGVEWQFYNVTNLKLFEKRPDLFVPAFGGYCAYSLADGEVDEASSPEAFVVHDGKLYFFHTKDMMKLWQQDPDAMIKRAEAQWKKLVKAEKSKTEESTDKS